MVPSQNWILGVRRIQQNQNFRFFDVDRLEPDITVFVKDSYRKIVISQNWVLRAEHGTQDSKNSKFQIFAF